METTSSNNSAQKSNQFSAPEWNISNKYGMSIHCSCLWLVYSAVGHKTLDVKSAGLRSVTSAVVEMLFLSSQPCPFEFLNIVWFWMSISLSEFAKFLAVYLLNASSRTLTLSQILFLALISKALQFEYIPDFWDGFFFSFLLSFLFLFCLLCVCVFTCFVEIILWWQHFFPSVPLS